MKAHKFPVTQIANLHPAVQDYLENTHGMNYPHAADVMHKASTRVHSLPYRQTLVESLLKQHAHLAADSLVLEHIHALQSENTFTITTGHQLGVFGGPLFVASKVLSVARMVADLNKGQQQYRFVPVFWMASEDHDFKEIQSVHWRDQSWTWNYPEASCVGALSTQNMDEGWDWLMTQCPEPHRHLLAQWRASAASGQYSISFRRMLAHWFEAFGVIVLDPNEKALKALFQEEMRKELFGEVGLHQVVSNPSHTWNRNGYEDVVHVRDINLFYFHEHGRYRMQRSEAGFELVGHELRWTDDEARELLALYPERFSPNVVMRPIYQETILPNVAYVGGPAEVAYWLQLSPTFDAFGMQPPAVFLRHHVTLVDENTRQKCNKINLSPEETLVHRDQIIQRWINMDLAPLERARGDIQQVMEKLRGELTQFDVNLGAAADAELHRMESGLLQLEKKWVKSMRIKEEASIKQLDTIRERLMPHGQPHERHDALALWWARGGDALFRQIYTAMDPFKPEWSFLSVPSSQSEI